MGMSFNQIVIQNISLNIFSLIFINGMAWGIMTFQKQSAAYLNKFLLAL